MGWTIALLVALLTVSGCGADYRPGVSGEKRMMPQNMPSNMSPEAPGARPR